jgi:hypothetical protein
MNYYQTDVFSPHPFSGNRLTVFPGLEAFLRKRVARLAAGDAGPQMHIRQSTHEYTLTVVPPPLLAF